jgi:hypothetical protein
MPMALVWPSTAAAGMFAPCLKQLGKSFFLHPFVQFDAKPEHSNCRWGMRLCWSTEHSELRPLMGWPRYHGNLWVTVAWILGRCLGASWLEFGPMASSNSRRCQWKLPSWPVEMWRAFYLFYCIIQTNANFILIFEFFWAS